MTGKLQQVGMDRCPVPDLFDPAVIQCPGPVYDRLREENPVYYYEKGNYFVVSKYADIKFALAHPEIFSNEIIKANSFNFTPKLQEVMMPAPALSVSDPPQHGRTRGLLDRAFSAGRVNNMEELMQGIVDDLIDAFIDRGEFEAYSELANPLPIFVIADQLGVPRADQQQFKIWSKAISECLDPGTTVERMSGLADLISDFNDYMLERRAFKSAHPADDIISVLASGQAPGADGDVKQTSPLSDAEFLSVLQFLIVGGNETTTAGITSVLRVLAENAELYARVRADHKLIRGLIEEVMRYESPVQGFFRTVKSDTELSGVALPKGSLIHLRYGAANRDPEIFTDPDTIKLDRSGIPQHLVFGTGIHHCIGQMLARKEILCVVRSLCERMTTLRIADPDYKYMPLVSRRSISALQLSFDRAVEPKTA